MSKENKVLLVTGASSDIGTAFIKRNIDKYALVYAHYNSSKSKLEDLEKVYPEKLVLLKADFSDAASVDNLIEKVRECGQLPDHIIHMTSPKPVNEKFHKFNWEDFENGINTSLRSIVMITKAFIPSMAKNKYGKVVFMLTSYVLGVPPKYQTPYVTAKYALLGLMKGLSAEYASKGITVNAVSPDMMETKFLSDLPDLIIEQNAADSPLKRILKVEDVIPSFEYLLSDGADTVNGVNIPVTAGIR
ncbi:MAG: SDR family oxidoreductase [Lachnospiraceae bacterium]|nr:SDR family oxidoreductase [Lachnospiraceae bacterium]